MALEIAPALVFFAGALVVALLRGPAQTAAMLLVPVLGMANLLGLDDGTVRQVEVMGLALTPLRVDGLSTAFGWLFHVGAFLGLVYASYARDTIQHVCALLYAGSAVGAVYAGDLVTLFVFWEMLALTSVFLIWARRTERSLAAGFRYLLVNIVSGLLLLTGAIVRVGETGDPGFGFIGTDSPGGWLILAAFGIKAAFPLVHNWVTDAYPEATPAGAVFLSALTTKVAVVSLARGFPGTEPLIYVGMVMAIFPLFYAAVEHDLRRVLSYALINQVGFMVCGVGLGTALALNGVVAHAIAHVIYESLLFMAMGAVLHMTGRIGASELGGLFRSMPLTAALCLVGSASIAAVPLFSGFVSKSMVISAAAADGHVWTWLALTFASAGVVLFPALKLPFFAFFGRDSGIRTKEAPLPMLLAMAGSAALCVGIGVFPSTLYALLPFDADYHPYDIGHVITQLQLLAFALLAFLWLRRQDLYPRERPSVLLDAEWIYRRGGARAIAGAVAFATEAERRLEAYGHAAFGTVLRRIYTWHGPQSALARSWTTGSMVLMMAVLLLSYLVIYFI